MPGSELPASEIRWHLEPFTPEPADEDPLVAALLESLAYRLVMSQALAMLHEAARHYKNLEEQHSRLRDEYRHLREQVMRGAAQ